MKTLQFIFLFFLGFNFLFFVGCDGSSASRSTAKKPDPDPDPDPTPRGPEFIINPPFVSPGNTRSPGFIIKRLPDQDVTISIYKGPLPTSQCEDSNLILVKENISVQASENEIVINNLGDILSGLGDGTYRFFAKIQGEGVSRCMTLNYIFDTTAPRIVANTLSGTDPLGNEDIPVMSKTWAWACQDIVNGSCTYRYKIDETPLAETDTSCGTHSFTPSDAYSSASTATKTGGDGRYCIHIQARDEAGNESGVVSVYATLDRTSPTVSSVSVPDGEYAGGDRIDVTVTFSEPVVVTGTPRIELSFGANGGQTQTKYAEYYKGSGSEELTFRYLVTQTDSDTDGIEMTNSIDLNSGTLKDAVGNPVHSLIFTLPTNLSDVTVDGDKANVILSLTDLPVGENGGTNTYTVRLNKQPSHPVTVVLDTDSTNLVNLSSATDTDQSSSTVTLEFEADNANNKEWSTDQTVTVTGVDDDIDNDVGDNPQRTTNITHTVTSSDTDYNNLTVGSVLVISRDDDDIGSIKLVVDPPVDVNESGNTHSISVKAEFEGSMSGGQASSSVRLDNDLVLSASVMAVSAQAEDFDPVSDFEIRILAGAVDGVNSFDLTVVDDLIDDDSETLKVDASNDFGLSVTPAVLTINDNDDNGVTVSPSSLFVFEDGGEKTYTVQLETEPTGPVRVVMSSADVSVATVSPIFLIFEPDNSNNKIWNTPQTVTITGVNKPNSQNTHQTTITHTVVGGGYDGISVEDVSVTSLDSRFKVTIDNAEPIIVDNYDDYSVGGACSGSENVSVQVGSVTAVSASCNSGSWTAENIDTSTDITANGPVTITAVQTTNDGSTSRTVSVTTDVTRCVGSGDGTSVSSPHWICNYDDLKDMFSANTRKYFVVGMDIEAGESWSEGDANCGVYDGTDIHDTDPCSGWIPLNGSITSGEFDGKGHIIRDLYINSDEDKVGLFGHLKMIIKNLHLRNVRINSTAGNSEVGGLAGKTEGDIENCSVTGILSGGSTIGGLVGESDDDILNSHANVQINTGNNSNAGGLAGFLLNSDLVISSYSRGSVTIDGTSGNAGGLVGWSFFSDYYSSYSHARVSGGDKSGGLVGKIEIPGSTNISHSYTLGNGSPNDPLFDTDGTPVNSSSNLFWDTDVSGAGSSEALNATGLSTGDMQADCSNSQTTGICALGEGFNFLQGSYPRVKKCTTCNTGSPVFGGELVGGQ